MNHEDANRDDESRPSRLPLIVTLSSLAVTAILLLLSLVVDNAWIDVAFLVAQVVVISIIIWQACDPFADAAQWIGAKFRLPGSVRGATLDAVASSMPELFTGIFFVIVAVIFSDKHAIEDLTEEAGQGYGNAVATVAGSAVYNMILIPAFCALVISFVRKKRPTIDVEPEVLSRDGMWFLGTSLLLILFLFQDHMYWWMGVVFLALYVLYIAQLYRDARHYQRALDAIHAHFDEMGVTHQSEKIVEVLRADGIRATPLLVERVREAIDKENGQEEKEDEPEDSAGLLFGYARVPLNHLTAWLVIAVATAVAAAACYWLVEVTYDTAGALERLINNKVPVFFVAVILAAAASSVPDTFLSIGAARRGDDSGAVSNAFGSNIFDICVCLSVPLLVSSYLLNWQPVGLTQDGKPMAGLVDLRILLVLLTFITLLIMWHQRQLNRSKALILCALYGVFIAYAVVGSFGFSFFEWLQQSLTGDA